MLTLKWPHCFICIDIFKKKIIHLYFRGCFCKVEVPGRFYPDPTFKKKPGSGYDLEKNLIFDKKKPRTRILQALQNSPFTLFLRHKSHYH